LNPFRLLHPRPPDPPPPGPDGTPASAPTGPPPFTLLTLTGVFGAVLAGLMSFLNTRLTSFALADLRGAYGYGVDESSWINTAFGVGSIIVVPFTPWLAGIVSMRRLFAASVALTTLAGMGCAEAPGYVALLLLRFLQGLGGGAIVPLLLVTVLRFSPLHQRIWGIAAYACITTLTPTVSETVAGWMTDYFTWKGIFWQNLILGPPVVALLLIGLPVEPGKPEVLRHTDWFALAFITIALAALTVALDQGQRLDWFDSGIICGLFALGAAALVAFVVNETLARPPLIDLGLLGIVNFAGGLVIIVGFNFALLGASYVLPQFGTVVKGWRELQVGGTLIWLAVPQLVFSPLAAWLLRVLDARLLMAAGFATFAAGACLGTYITSDWVTGDLLPGLAVQACAFPFIMVPLVFIATSALQPKDAPSGATLFNVMRTLAGTVGAAIVGGVVTVRERVHSNTILEHVGAGGAAPHGPVPLSLGQAIPPGMAGQVAQAARAQASVMAYADVFGMLGLVAVLCLGLVLVLRETRVVPPPGRPQTDMGGEEKAPVTAS